MTITESDSNHDELEKKSIGEILTSINAEDREVAEAVNEAIPSINDFLNSLIPRMKEGGRLFYIGAGTSGRLGILDASECPPTYGVDHNTVIGIIAGGDSAIRKAVEFAEDDENQAWLDLKAYGINKRDTLVGIAASGRTPYVIGGVKEAKQNGLTTACITCNPGSELAKNVDFPIEVIVGPEFVTGSTRMKAGTAQKMVLNMISTTAMIGLGRVKGNKMVDMQLSNNKLVDRGVKMLVKALNISREQAEELLEKYGSVRVAIEEFGRA